MPTIVETADSIVLQAGQSKAEIWPGCGAILNSWQVHMHNRSWQLVDGYDSLDDFKSNCEKKGFRSCKLSPFVCRMHHGKYVFDEKELTIEKFYLGDHAIHGLLYDIPFTVISTYADENNAVVILQHKYHSEDKGYPFQYELQVTYTLSERNQLGIATSVTNTDKHAIPITDGWHPYFALGRAVDELELSMQTSDMLEFDATLIPTGEFLPYTVFNQPASLKDVEFDNCFRLRQSRQAPACSIINRKDNIQLSIYPDISYPYLQVYIPPHRNSIAIENLSAAPDAFNNQIGLIYLDPKETMSFSTSFRVSEVL
jgi:aldose 1-epimerase